MTQAEFRELTKRVFNAEKPGFWSDWTKEQQDFVVSGDWKSFSRSRGYTEDEIAECELWQNTVVEKRDSDIGWLSCISDIATDKLIEKIGQDKNGELVKSTVGPVDMRGAMVSLEKSIKNHPLSKGSDDFPLTHTFTDGQYIRESFVPKGVLFTTRIHKVEHPMFIMSGDVSILTDEGFRRVKAPYYTITKPGTKRVVLTHEDTVCITVHPTKCKDVESAEQELWADTFEEVGIDYKERELLCLR